MVQNIYESRHYKLFILVPLALMLISIYFIPKIQLDSSLRGGISVQIQTNATPDLRALTASIDSQIPGAQASVSRAPGGLSVTMADNESLVTGEGYLSGLYGAYGNYSQYTLNITEAEGGLSTDPSNSTLIAVMKTAKAGQNVSVAEMRSDFDSEMADLRPLLGGAPLPQYNSSNYALLLNAAQGTYSNASAKYQGYVVNKLKGLISFTVYSYNEVTPTLGAYFLSQVTDIIIIAFVLVAIAVFVVFRTPVPSFAVVFGATNDIVVALGMMGLLGIPLGIASVGGLLMLLGYSIDTDMLSSIRVIKRHDATPEARGWSSMKTGITMTVTAIISFGVLFVVSYLAFIPTYFEISAVVLVGLMADLAATWLANMPIILWYKKRKDSRLKR
jgi:preprotein translocase subunit SecF